MVSEEEKNRNMPVTFSNRFMKCETIFLTYIMGMISENF